MRRNGRRLRVAALVTSLLGVGMAASAIEAGEAAGGQPYLIGGIGLEEIAMLDLAREQFNLRVRTAVRRSGEYLADVRLRITDAQGRVVFDRELSGPELLIRLEPGRYALQAATSAEVQRIEASVNATGQRDVVIYFRATPDS